MDHPSVGKLVRYEASYPTARITMNRADKRNALSRELIDDLTTAFRLARDDDRVRCIILAAAGPVFCVGMDLGELHELLQTPPDCPKVWEEALRLGRLCDLIYTAPKPTLALVAGPAVAGGSVLVTVCDLALATPEARFGYPGVRRGLVGPIVMPHLLRHVGERLARYLLLTGELIDAATAMQCGLINEVVSAEQMPARVAALVNSLVEGGPEALTRTKSLLRQFSRQALSVEETAKASAAPQLFKECQEGLRAFFEKKPAPWVA